MLCPWGSFTKAGGRVTGGLPQISCSFAHRLQTGIILALHFGDSIACSCFAKVKGEGPFRGISQTPGAILSAIFDIREFASFLISAVEVCITTMSMSLPYDKGLISWELPVYESF